MTRRIPRRAAALLAATLLTALAASPSAAAPPERLEVDAFIIALDIEHELVVFWNISRDDFCAWEASGFDGPPPVTRLIPAQEHVSAGGQVLMARVAGTSALELWNLDEGADLSGPCQDTDDQVAPWATGTAVFRSNDNDVDVSLTRTNAYGERIIGSVVDIDGNTWRFANTFQTRSDRNDEFFLMTDNFTLAPGG